MAGVAAAKRIEAMKKPVIPQEAETIAHDSGWLPVPLRTASAPITATSEAEARAA